MMNLKGEQEFEVKKIGEKRGGCRVRYTKPTGEI